MISTPRWNILMIWHDSDDKSKWATRQQHAILPLDSISCFYIAHYQSINSLYMVVCFVAQEASTLHHCDISITGFSCTCTKLSVAFMKQGNLSSLHTKFECNLFKYPWVIEIHLFFIICTCTKAVIKHKHTVLSNYFEVWHTCRVA